MIEQTQLNDLSIALSQLKKGMAGRIEPNMHEYKKWVILQSFSGETLLVSKYFLKIALQKNGVM